MSNNKYRLKINITPISCNSHITSSYKGITLVALVITVIVLLILAGVAISAIVGENGIFSKARISAEKYNNAAENEEKTINELISSDYLYEEPISNGKFSKFYGVNTPNTSKLPISTTKYITWTGETIYTEILNDTMPSDWYNYKQSKWANIKTTSTDGTLEAYWVWIPRFAYKLPENGITPKTIEVAFAKGDGTTVINPITGLEEQAYYATDTAITTDGSGLYIKKTGDAANKWIIHPAFSFGNSTKSNENTQLSGIWVAKYEASSSNPSASNGGDNTTALKVQVKPNVTIWRNISAANCFTVSRTMQDSGGSIGTLTGAQTVNTHLIKNMEWGAVAILSQSKYGNYNLETNINMQVWNNPNSSFITGSSGVSKDQANIANANCYAYNTQNGIKASTTGNVYGIYDMAGGGFEQIASSLSGYANLLGNPEKKYYELYTNPTDSYTNYDGTKIGDVIKELSPASEISWYGDRARFTQAVSPILIRGALYADSTEAGIFAFGRTNGDPNVNNSFRPILLVF